MLNISKQRKARPRKLKAAIRRQLEPARYLDVIDALIAYGAKLLAPKVHWWRKLLIISEMHREQTILLYAKTRSIPDRFVNLIQRHIRPSVRGKSSATVGFEAKFRSLFRMAFPSYTR